MPFPLQVILAILGLPESDYPRMLQLTQELFGSSDEELSRGQSMEDLMAVINDFFVYFTPAHRGPPGAPDRTTSRRSSPTPRSTASRSGSWRRSRTT